MASIGDNGEDVTRFGRLAEIWQTGSVSIWLLRTVAMFLLLFSLIYWVRLTGVFSGPEFRFDTMPVYWRIAASVLAVAMPVTALGLWNGSSWGVVLWFPVMFAEVLMYGWFASLYGYSGFRIMFHVLTGFLYLAIRLAMHYWPPARSNGTA